MHACMACCVVFCLVCQQSLILSAGNWRNALRDSQQALQLDPSSLKAGRWAMISWLTCTATCLLRVQAIDSMVRGSQQHSGAMGMRPFRSS